MMTSNNGWTLKVSSKLIMHWCGDCHNPIVKLNGMDQKVVESEPFGESPWSNLMVHFQQEKIVKPSTLAQKINH